MQRGTKKSKLPVNIVTKAGKSTSVKPSKQENLVASKKKPVSVADRATKKSKTETPANISTASPKASKTAKVKQPSKQKNNKIAAPVSVKKPSAKTVLIKPQAQNKKIKNIEKKVEVVAPPSIPKPIKKKIKPISSAVVRGKNGCYDFEVFSLDAELKDGSAIYVISKRVTDKRGKGHHKFVCIGQTESLLGDLKKHKKDKCIKQYKANVICLLREENEKNRLKIETDLREAHTIVCNQK